MNKPTITIRSLKIVGVPHRTCFSIDGVDPVHYPCPQWKTVQELIDWLDQKYPDGYLLEANIRDEWDPAEARFESSSSTAS